MRQYVYGCKEYKDHVPSYMDMSPTIHGQASNLGGGKIFRRALHVGESPESGWSRMVKVTSLVLFA